VKNNYPLLLISDVLENIGTKKVFTKMDLSVIRRKCGQTLARVRVSQT